MFSLSLGDIWDNQVDPAWRRDAFDLARECPNLVMLYLSKRIGNAVDMAREAGGLPPNAALGSTFGDQRDYDRDRMKLAYLLLLMEAWRRPNCDLPDDDRFLARLAGVSAKEWTGIKPVVMEFWTRDGRSKTWKQKRLSKERDAARKRSKSQKDNSAKRWNKTEKGDATGYAKKSHGNPSTATATAIEEEEEAKASPSLSEREQAADLIEDITPPAPPKRKPKAARTVGEDHPMPDDWTPSLGPKAQAMVDGWPPGMLDREEFAFRSHASANGRLAKNWDGAFGTWLKNAEDRRVEHGNGDNRSNAPRNYGQRDNRDGFQRALDRRIFGDGEAGRQPARGDDGFGELPLASPPALQR